MSLYPETFSRFQLSHSPMCRPPVMAIICSSLMVGTGVGVGVGSGVGVGGTGVGIGVAVISVYAVFAAVMQPAVIKNKTSRVDKRNTIPNAHSVPL